MKLVLDTNVLVAAAISRGTCAELLEHCVRRHHPVTSEFILREVEAVLVKNLDLSPREAAEVAAVYRSRMSLVAPSPLPQPACRDRSDDAILGTAVAGRCHCLVSGDKDLLVLKSYRGIAIVSPSRFWTFEAGTQPGAPGG